ncbi:S-layer homology domain-containing protein [Cohnella zeiphila]|uniref:S-layer homology domain-containing protein n=1 Tax=Cohnella zeiphila TaxID=2761120 RepID=A0A7X0VV33_9BACL|nr:S-layer homology domain-containing protein [Cohnella zeiphila]MBB6730942.1 S-layer homology domain-containing protein [Cohnella zeiphila]
MLSAKPNTRRRAVMSGVLSAALAVSGFAGTVVGGTNASAAAFVPPQAAIDHLQQDDWAQLQQILTDIYGSISSPLKITDVSKGGYTAGQLMGNGDIGAIAAGVSTTSQQYYFAKNDFWGTLHAQSNSVKDNQGILSGGGLAIRPTTGAGSGADSAFSMKQDILNAQVTTTMQIKSDAGSDATVRLNSWTADTDNVFVTEVTNDGDATVTLNAKQWVPAMAYAGSSASDLSDANATYPYTGGIDDSGATGKPVLWTTRDSNAGATGNTSNFRSRMATATTLVGADLTDTREVREATDYYDANKGKYYDSLGESGDFSVPAQSKVYLVTYFASSSGAYDAIKSVDDVQADAVAGVEAYATSEAIDQLRADHRNWWQNYWLKSYVQFGDPDLNRYYYGSLYVLGSSNRPTSANGKVNPQNLPGSMYGPWIPADNMGWGGRYFLNYNQQAQYYASGSVNRIDTVVPYNRVIAYELPWNQNNTAAQGFDGVAGVRTQTPFHLLANSQPAFAPIADTKLYGFNNSSTDQKSNGMFAAVPMIFYYEYTLDDDYLKNVLYPHLKQLMTFYSSYVLKTDDGNGQYHYSVIGSSIHEGDAADINPDLDIGAIKLLARFLIDHASAMNEDPANVSRWRDLADHTAYPEAMLPQGSFSAANAADLVPTLLATDYQSPNQAHVDMIEPGDQPVELEGVVFPFENVQVLDGDKELLQKVRNTLAYMNAWAASGFSGWSSQNNGFPKVFPIAARAGWPAGDLLDKFKTALNAKQRLSNLTYLQSGGAVETIGSMEALDSMLLQSETSTAMPSTIQVFPNWDPSRSVRFERLGAKGNVEVSSAYDADSQTVPYIDLHSRRDGQISLVNPWTVGKPVVRMVNSDRTWGADVDYTIQGGKIVFDAASDARYLVMNDDSVTTARVSDMTLDKYASTLIYGGADGTDTTTVTATISGNPADTVIWTSSDRDVVAVTADGNSATLQAVGHGANPVTEVTVTATSVQDSGISQTLRVKVADVSTVPTELKSLNPATATIYGPSSTSDTTSKVSGANRLQLTAEVLPDNAYDKTVRWTSSDQRVAMVDKNGLVIARGAGTVEITGTGAGNPDLPPIKTIVTVTPAGNDNSGSGTLANVLAAAKLISAYKGDRTSGGGFSRVSAGEKWEGLQESFQKAYINALGVKAMYSGYGSPTNISKDTALFAAIALNEAIRAIDPSLAVSTVDKTGLDQAIGKAVQYDAGQFSAPEDWEALQSALGTAQATSADPDATQEEADAALAALQTAMAKALPLPEDLATVRIPRADMTAPESTVYGSSVVQLQSSLDSPSWSVKAEDGSATAAASINDSGVLYVSEEGTYQVTAGSGDATEQSLISFTSMFERENLTFNGNGNGTAFGSTNSGSYPPTKVFDGDPNTFFDHSSSTPYVGWDFGGGNEPIVNFVLYQPRSGTNMARVKGAKFQGSNVSATSGYTDLFTVPSAPTDASKLIAVAFDNKTPYRYYRWLGADGTHGNVAELQMYQIKDSAMQRAPDGAAQAADSIEEIANPVKDAVQLALPAVPTGFTVAIASSDNESVIAKDGTIVPPAADTTVHLILTLTRVSDGAQADTASLQVVVPARSLIVPGAPGHVAAIAEGTNGAALAWDAVPGADGYNVYRSDSGEEGSFVRLNESPLNSNEFHDTELASNRNYQYYVTAVNAAGESAPSAIASVRPQPITYTVSASAGEHGTIDPSGDVTVNEGADQTFAFAPEDGYVIDAVTVDGSQATVVNDVYTFEHVSRNHTIDATFREKTEAVHTIAASAGEHGAADPNGELSVIDGADQSFAFTPEDGYAIDTVTVDGTLDVTSSLVDGVFTFQSVSADHTIAATFKPVPVEPVVHTIAARAGGHGTISPNGTVTVNDGGSQTFTVTPDNGYTIDAVTVDGVAVAVIGSAYTFENVTSDHTIAAAFKPVPVVPPVTPPAALPPTPPAELPADMQAVTSEELRKAAAAGEAIITLAEGKTQLQLPADAANWLGSEPLVVQAGTLSLIMPGSIWKQMADSLPKDGQAGAHLVLKISPLSEEETGAIVAQSASYTQAQLHAAGPAIDFGLTLVAEEGTETPLTTFDEPLTVRLRLDPSADPALTFLYGIDEEGKLEFIGGHVADGELVASLHHFSKYAAIEFNKPFADVSASHWAYPAIERLAARGIVNGTDDTSFRPDRQVTRAEFTSLLVRGLNLSEQGKSGFSDVAANAWYANEVAAAAQAGLVNGKTATTFEPDGAITREEMVVMLMRAYELKNGQPYDASQPAAFADERDIASWAIDSVHGAYALGLIDGRGAGVFDPEGAATRAEAARVIEALLES